MNIRKLATPGLALLLVVGSATTAFAKDGDVEVVGSCTARSSAELKLSPENGKIEVEFEVDQNRNGQKWNVTITDNGVRVATGSATTVAPSGSFSFERVVANRAGTDKVVATATNPATGEKCTATASF